MISAQVCSRGRALSRRLALHWQERSSCLSQWIQHTDFVWHYSMYTRLTLGYSATWLHQEPTPTPSNRQAWAKSWPMSCLSPNYHIFLSKWQGTASETAGDGGSRQHPPAPTPLPPSTTQPPAQQGTFPMEGGPGDWGGLKLGKTLPWSPHVVWLLWVYSSYHFQEAHWIMGGS